MHAAPSSQDPGTHALEVLKENVIESAFTRPSPRAPFTHNTASVLASIGLISHDRKRAHRELDRMVEPQWENGLIPLISFPDDEQTYRISIDATGSARVSAPPNEAAFGLIALPLQAWALHEIYQTARGPREERVAFLRPYYDKILAFHRHIAEARDPEHSGLVTLFHPWESGALFTDEWERTLGRVSTPPNESLSPLLERMFSDMGFLYNTKRPLKATYLELLLSMQADRYDTQILRKTHPFQVKGLLYSTLFYLANMHLAEIARFLRRNTDDIDTWMRHYEHSLFSLLWDAERGRFSNFDTLSERTLPTQSPSSVVPLITPLVKSHHEEGLLSFFTKELLCTNGACAARLILPRSMNDTIADPSVYHTVPTAAFTNWLFWRGLRATGRSRHADMIRSEFVGLTKENGLFSLYHPLTGHGIAEPRSTGAAGALLHMLRDKL